MKKIIIAIAILFGTVGFVKAQTTTAAPKTKKEKKAKTTTAVTPATTVQTKGTKKDGTPDMRLKANKVKATAAPAPAAAPAAAPVATAKPVKAPKTKAVTSTTKAAPAAAAVKTADKAIGTDAKGRTIYQGPRGGKYYIDKSGNKEYVK